MIGANLTVLAAAYKRGAIAAVTLLVVGAILGELRPRPWPILLATVVVTAMILLVGERVIRSQRERIMWAAVAVTGGPWLAVTAARGLSEIRAALLVWGLIGFPGWWTWHRRIRRQDRRTLDLIGQWTQAAAAEGLEGATLLPTMDHATGNWRATVQLPDGQHVEDARRAARRLESRMHLPPEAITVTATDDASVVELSVIARRPSVEAVAWPGAPRDATITRPTVIGAYHDGGPVELLLRSVHVLIAGMTGAGKSGVVNELVGYLAACRDVVLWGIDLKGGLELRPWAPVFQRVATTLPDALELLRDAMGEIQARPTQMPEGLRQYPVSESHPALVIVVDEAREVTFDREARELLERITALGRALDVTVILATQYPTRQDLKSSVLIQQMTVKVGLRVSNATASRVIFGEGATAEGWNPHTIPRNTPGTLYIQAPDAETPQLARAFHVTDSKVRETVARYRAGRPVLAELEAPREPGGGEAPEPIPTDPVLAALQVAGEDGLATGLLLAQVELPRSTVNYQLAKLRDQGRVEQVDRGRWRVVQ